MGHRGRILFSPLVAFLVLALPCSAVENPQAADTSASSPAHALEAPNLSPALFVENAGQWDDSILYAHRGRGINVLFTEAGPVFQLTRSDVGGAGVGRAIVSARFLGANEVAGEGFDESRTKANFYRGSDPTAWRTGVASFEGVVCRDLYDGIDFYAWARPSGIKYEFHVAPGGDPGEIAVRYEGIEGLSLDGSGALHVKTPLGEMIDEAPVVYQDAPAGRVEIAARFRIIDEATYGFEVAGAYNPQLALVIDPILVWGTFITTKDSDAVYDVVTDSSGNIWVVGRATSNVIVTGTGVDLGAGGDLDGDVMVAKITPSLEYDFVSMIGGSGNDIAWAISLDSAGDAWVVGATASTDFPAVAGGDASANGNEDGILIKLDRQGQVLYSGYIGGSSRDRLWDVAVAANGDVWLSGNTISADMPIVNGFDDSQNGSSYWDIFLACMSDAGAIRWSTYLGGTGNDSNAKIAFDSQGDLWLVAATESTDIPTPGGFDTVGGPDFYIAKIAQTSDPGVTPVAFGISWASYLGGSDWDEPRDFVIDENDFLWIAGMSRSSDFPMPSANADRTLNSYADAVIAGISPSYQVVWASYLGAGAGSSAANAIAVDSSGNLFVAGKTDATDFPTPNGFTAGDGGGGGGVFIVKIDPDHPDEWLRWGGLVSGSAGETGNCIALDGANGILLGGRSSSHDFPTPGADLNTSPAAYGAFLLRVLDDPGGNGLLSASPGEDLAASGPQGGPFAPVAGSYILTNTGSDSLAYEVHKAAGWIETSTSSGTLGAGASETVTLSLGADAATMPAGVHSERIEFVNTTNGMGNTNRKVALWITEEPVSITTESLPDAEVAQAYSETLAAAGGTPPYTWAIISGSLPDGLALEAATGVFTGTPTQQGEHPFTVEALDSTTPALSAQRTFPLYVDYPELVITSPLPSLPTGYVGAAYSQVVEAVGGLPPYTWSIISGSLPEGLSLGSATGLIGGTPTVPGDFPFTIQVSDSRVPARFAPASLSITVETPPITLDASVPRDAVRGEPYSGGMTASGGAAPYTFTMPYLAVEGQEFPPGLSLSETTGSITGTPSQEGAYAFTVHVQDVEDQWGEWSFQIDVTVLQPVEITTTALAGGVIAQSYSATLAATGGMTPYSWSHVAGSLPPGLILDAASGEISGSPTAYGDYSFTVEVDESSHNEYTDRADLSIHVAPPPLQVTTTSLPAAPKYSTYTVTLAAVGGKGAYTWEIAGGALPPGLSLDAESAVISGSPTSMGTYNFTVRVQDQDAPPNADTRALSITINAEDLAAPVVSSVATVPTLVRDGIDESLTLTATASDAAGGDSTIAGAEYFIGVDPGAGGGTAMSAADGAFDSSTEPLVATVPTTSPTWRSMGVRRINVRAMDRGANWTSPVAHIDVSVVDGTAPAAVWNLQLESAVQPQVALYYGGWTSIGAITDEAAELLIDLGSQTTVAGVGLLPRRPSTLFPRDFSMALSSDAVSWTTFAAESNFKPTRRQHLWLTGDVEARYVRITAVPRYDGRSRHYYAAFAGITVYSDAGAGTLTAMWTAPADDAGDAGSGPVSEYDLRYAAAPITEDSFAACQGVSGVPSPGPSGVAQSASWPAGDLSGAVYAAIKTGDEVPNWSEISNVASAQVATGGGLWPTLPEDDVSLPAGWRGEFSFARGEDFRTAFIQFSDRGDFPGKPVKNPDGTKSKTLKFPLKKAATLWAPTKAQYKQIKKAAAINGRIHWRLAGKPLSNWDMIYTPARTIHYDSGTITDLAVAPSHDTGGGTALWPDALTPPTFSWTNDTKGMTYFYVDVSTDPTIPTGDRKKTVTIPGRGVKEASYTLKKGEWKKVYKLATWLQTRSNPNPARGVLYWRVRAVDSDRTLACASGVETLVIDGGAFDLNDVDLSGGAPLPEISWGHTGDGVTRFALEFSHSETFPPSARDTLKMGRPSQATTRSFSAAEIGKLRKFAARHLVAALYYRVRGENADRRFVTYSEAKTAIVP